MAEPGEWSRENEDPYEKQNELLEKQKAMMDDYIKKVSEMFALRNPPKPVVDFGQGGSVGSDVIGYVVNNQSTPPVIIEKIENGYVCQVGMMLGDTRKVYCGDLKHVTGFLFFYFAKGVRHPDDAQKG
jgi:hypothetical protein